MIQEIAISHFRCFRETKIKGFARVNLIGGLNNAGKTAFLEALLLNGSPTLETLLILRNQRGESDLYAKEFPANTWDYLFYGQDKDKMITIETLADNNRSTYVKINCYEESEERHKLSYELLNYESLNNRNYSFLRVQTQYKDYLDAILSDKKGIYLHDIDYEEDYKNDSQNNYNNINYGNGYGESENDFNYGKEFSRNFNINLIPAHVKQTGTELAKAYSKADYLNKAHLVKKALKLADNTIVEIKISILKGINLLLQREGENAMPVSMFGDAINKIVHIILTVINNNSSILLIDEIENGIHYTVQRQFWKYLFTLAKEFDIQIFATTHSLEMIQAFAEVASLGYKEEATYFEFIRHIKTQEIDANRHEIDTLKYELINHLSIRGE